MIAILSDIHANLEALKAVLAAMGNPKAIYCAGDIVGYGPNPNECCELLRAHNVKSVMGNHDIVCANYGLLETDDDRITERVRRLARMTRDEMNSVARRCCEWTYNVLSEENRSYLRSLPLVLREGKITMLHGSPGSDYHKLNTYLEEKYDTLSNEHGRMGLDFTEFCRDLLDEMRTKLLIVGHTHLPYKGYVFKRAVGRYLLPFLSRDGWVINPGGVGQPRKGKKAMFATVEFPLFPYLKVDASFRYLEHNVRHHAVRFDRRTTLRKIQDIQELPEDCRFMLGQWF